MKIKVNINVDQLVGKFEALADDECGIQIHSLFKKMCSPYVPMDTGVLADKYVLVDKDKVVYKQPYAHYQYIGEVYGPNIPIFEDGVLVGFWSPPGKGTKHPTGRPIQYNKEKHPLASKEWDKAMMSAQGEQFVQQVKDILIQRCKELYG